TARDVMIEGGQNCDETTDCETPVRDLMARFAAGADRIAVVETGTVIGEVRGPEIMAKLLNPRGD
ncbi:MAG: choline ABC transporter ATP-binding protein, partial [Gemmobacter sp.]|nr:choline ABC transporter ATP-binding protein [Gemmobacter sp.]